MIQAVKVCGIIFVLALATTSCAEKDIATRIEDPKCSLVTTKPEPKITKVFVEPCINAQLAAYIAVNNTHYFEFKNGSVGKNSRCESKVNGTTIDPRLVINYDCGELEFEIARDHTSTFVKAINGFYMNSYSFSNSTPMFRVNDSGHYYQCNSEQPILVHKDTHLVLSNLAIEAYRNTNSTNFYQIPEECSLDVQPVSDLVRVGVGICLVALVAIVLIAYFIGRRRWSERSSYESV